MKKQVLFSCVLVFSFLSVLLAKHNEKSNYEFPPNIMVNEVVYWFSRSESDLALIKDYSFVGFVEKVLYISFL